MGHAAGCAVGRGTAVQARRSQFRFPMVSLEIFIDIILPRLIVALGSTQPLKEMSTRSISLVDKSGRCVRLTTLPLLCADCLEIWGASTSRNPQGLSIPVMGLFYLYLVENVQKIILDQRNRHYNTSDVKNAYICDSNSALEGASCVTGISDT